MKELLYSIVLAPAERHSAGHQYWSRVSMIILNEFSLVITLQAHARAGVMLSGLVSILYIFIYILYNYMYTYDPQKSLNGTLAVDLPFQTLAVDFSLNL